MKLGSVRITFCTSHCCPVSVPSLVRLIELSGTLVTSTSANLPGEPPAREVCEISEDVLDGADCVIDGGRCEYGVASTVVDLVDMQILRKGAGYEQAARCLR